MIRKLLRSIRARRHNFHAEQEEHDRELFKQYQQAKPACVVCPNGGEVRYFGHDTQERRVDYQCRICRGLFCFYLDKP